MFPVKATEMDRASDTTDSGISIRPLGGAGGEPWPLPVVGGMEERADKASQTDIATNQGPFEKTHFCIRLMICHDS